MISLTLENGRVRLRLDALLMGRDLQVCLYGGDAPHIGATALAHPHERPFEAGADAAAQSAAASVLTLRGHREDELARETALLLARSLGVAVCVSCGIHIENITREEIALCRETSLLLAEKLRKRLCESSGGFRQYANHQPSQL